MTLVRSAVAIARQASRRSLLALKFERAASSTTIGFVGLGKIGAAMATNLLQAGHCLAVHDVEPSAVERLRSEGAATPGSVAEVARAVGDGVCFTVLPNDASLVDVVQGGGLLEALSGSGAVHVSCSTVSPHTSRSLADQHTAAGASFVSAPVFARPDGMRAAQATIPISGAPDAVARARPLLEATSTGVYEFGGRGPANVAKLCGNYLIAAAIEANAEALALAEAEGVARDQLINMLSSTIFNCLIYRGYGARVAARDHYPHPDAHFALELGLKARDKRAVTPRALLTLMPLRRPPLAGCRTRRRHGRPCAVQCRWGRCCGTVRSAAAVDRASSVAIGLAVSADAVVDITKHTSGGATGTAGRAGGRGTPGPSPPGGLGQSPPAGALCSVLTGRTRAAHVRLPSRGPARAVLAPRRQPKEARHARERESLCASSNSRKRPRPTRPPAWQHVPSRVAVHAVVVDLANKCRATAPAVTALRA